MSDLNELIEESHELIKLSKILAKDDMRRRAYFKAKKDQRGPTLRERRRGARTPKGTWIPVSRHEAIRQGILTKQT